MRHLLYLGGHPLHRDALGVALCRFGLRLVTAVSLPDAIDRLHAGGVDAALADSDALGEEATLDAVAAVLRKTPNLVVGVVTGGTSPAFPAAAIRAGATGVLTNGASLAEFRYAVERMLEGHLVVDPVLARSLLGVVRPAASHEADGPRPPHLTPVERRVLALAADGFLTKQIAHELALSPLTVKNHLARIRARLGATDKAHAVATAMRAGLLE